MVITLPKHFTEANMIAELNTHGDPPDDVSGIYCIFFGLAILGCNLIPFSFYWGIALMAPVVSLLYTNQFKSESTRVHISVGAWITFVLYILFCIFCTSKVNTTETVKNPITAIVSVVCLLAIYLNTIRVVGMRKEVDVPNNEIRYYKRQYSNIIPLNYRYVETLYKTELLKRPRPNPPSVTGSGRK